MLYWVGRVVFGPLKEPSLPHHDDNDENMRVTPVCDLSLREWVVLVPLAVMVLFMGVYPKPVIRSLEPPVQSVVDSLKVNPG